MSTCPKVMPAAVTAPDPVQTTSVSTWPMVMPAAGISSLGNAGPSGCAGGNDGETSPRRRHPTGTPPGTHGYDVWGYGGHAGWKVFQEGTPEDRARLGTTWRTPGASCPAPNVRGRDGRSGVTPKREPILTRNGCALERPAHFGQGIGWLARKLSSRVPPCLRVIVRLSLTCIQTADVTPWSCTPSIPTASWQASSDGKSSPSRKTQSLEFPSELEELQRRDPGWVKRYTTTQLVAVKRPILRVGETGVRSVSPLIRLRIRARPMTGRPCGR